MSGSSAESPNHDRRGRSSSRSRRRTTAREEFRRLLDDLQRKVRHLEARIEETERAPAPAEGRFRALVDALPLPLAHLSALRGERDDRNDPGEIVDFVCRYVNPAGLSSIGWSGERSPVGRRLLADLLRDSEGAARLFEGCRSVVESGRPWSVEGHRCRNRGRDDRETGAEERSGVFDLQAGKLDDAVVLAWRRVAGPEAGGRDVPEPGTFGDRTLILTLAHELKTPLNALLGFCDLLRSEIVGALNEAQKVQLERIRRSCRHLSSIIETAASAWGSRDPEEHGPSEEVDLRDLLHDVSELMELEADRRGLQLEVAGPDDPVEVRTDPGKVRQVLINLVSNAVKHTGDRVHVVLEEGDDGWIRFRVRDNGPGIPEEHREEIFEPFVRLDGPGEEAAGETGRHSGIGLSVCRRLAGLLDGEVSVESTVGEGSTFTLQIPRA